MPEPLNLDEIVAGTKQVVVPPLLPGSGPALLGTFLRPGEIERVIDRAKRDSADEAAAYFLQALLIAIENLAQGNKLVAGRAMDDALTHFLADLKAELGSGYAANASALLIRNIALFLPPPKRDMVLAALDAETSQ